MMSVLVSEEIYETLLQIQYGGSYFDALRDKIPSGVLLLFLKWAPDGSSLEDIFKSIFMGLCPFKCCQLPLYHSPCDKEECGSPGFGLCDECRKEHRKDQKRTSDSHTRSREKIMVYLKKYLSPDALESLKKKRSYAGNFMRQPRRAPETTDEIQPLSKRQKSQ
jgi:hypothetical protein